MSWIALFAALAVPDPAAAQEPAPEDRVEGSDPDGVEIDTSQPDEEEPVEPEPVEPPAAPPPPQPMSEAERAALKAEIKAELKAEMTPEPEVVPVPPPATPPEEVNELVPEGQVEDLGKHALNNDKNAYKPGSGVYFESEDGAFALAMRLRLQLLQQLSVFEGDNGTELEQSFQLRRARVQFKGHAFNEHNKYKLELAFSPRDLNMRDGVPHNTPLLTWYLEFNYLRDFTIRAGQYKIPYSRQRVVSSGDLQLVDRSIAQGEFNHDRDIGFDVRSEDLGGLGGYLRYYAGVYMGEGRDFGDRNGTPDFKLHYLGRVEVLPMGDFEDYSEADIERNPTPKLSLGAAYSFHHDAQLNRGTIGSAPADGGVTPFHSFNVDYAFKYAGFSSTSEFHWRRGTRKAGDATIEDPNDPTMTIPAPVTAARNGVGVHVQAGYLLPRTRFEIAARYSGIRGIGDEGSGLVDGTTSLGREDALGAGLNYYFASHSWKLQGDYEYSWEDGDRATAVHLARVQVQLAL